MIWLFCEDDLLVFVDVWDCVDWDGVVLELFDVELWEGCCVEVGYD